MKIDPEAEMRAVLEPLHEEVGRVVAAALGSPAPGPRPRVPLMVAAGAIAALAILTLYIGQAPSCIEPLLAGPAAEAAGRLSNSGSVKLVKEPSGRTLIANRAAGAQATDGETSYRLMISKGIAP